MRHEFQGDDPQEEAESFPADDGGFEPTQPFLPYESALPLLPLRRPQPVDYSVPAPAPKPAQIYETGMDQQASRSSVTFGIAKFNQFLKWLLSVLEVMFGLRFTLKLLDASPKNPFIELLNNLTQPLLQPFTAAFGAQTGLVEWDTLLAMLVYFLVILALVRFLRLFVTDPEP